MGNEGGRDRIAALVVVSSKLSVSEISDIVGVQPDLCRELGSVRTDAPIAVPAGETSWELTERHDRSAPLSDLVDRLALRIFPLADRFIRLRDRGCGIKLELVQWISPGDPVGPGFSLDKDLIEFLSRVGAVVDVDQYSE